MNELPKLPNMVVPSFASTAAFVVVALLVVATSTAIVARAWKGEPSHRYVTPLSLMLLLGWMATTASLAETGFLASLANSPKLLSYVGVSNGIALVLALSALGRRIVQQVPIAGLVAFQGFRLPLELVLHSWYEQGTLPVQMTYAGANFDIATGVIALCVGALLHLARLSEHTRWRIVLGFNLVGFGLLVTVMNIAIRSTPWPLRTYLNEPPVLLVFHAPYTWILPVCVAGALWAHVLVFRWLVVNRPDPKRE